MRTCNICQTELKSHLAKTCSSLKCKSKWKILRNKQLPLKTKECLSCKTSFETKDIRNNFCSPTCKTEQTHQTKLKKYGKRSTTSPWEARKHKVLKTLQDRYEGSFKRKKWLTSRGYSNIEQFIQSVYNFCTTHNIAPNSQKCLDHFKMSTYMNRLLTDYGLDDILHNSSRVSQQELEIREFLHSECGSPEMVNNHRPKFMMGKELDIFIPSKNLAIEFHGLVFHSERPVYGELSPKRIQDIKKIHEYKYLVCKKNDIKLLQIFEDEWRDKRDIVKSMISNQLGRSLRIHARNTEMRALTKEQKSKFFNENHIAGDVKSSISLGLFKEEVLVSAVSLRKTWNKRYGKDVYEIARFCSTLNTSVMGGFSKLMKYVKIAVKGRGGAKILTYADCRFGSGNVYLKYGFEYLGKTRPNYYYEKGGIREDRFKHRKNNDLEYVKEFGDTERAQNNNQDRYAIYDAGSEIYTLTLP